MSISINLLVPLVVLCNVDYEGLDSSTAHSELSDLTQFASKDPRCMSDCRQYEYRLKTSRELQITLSYPKLCSLTGGHKLEK